MKKIYFSLMLLCAMAFTSCSMDKAPYGSLDDNTAIEKEKDLRQFRTALYTIWLLALPVRYTDGRVPRTDQQR